MLSFRAFVCLFGGTAAVFNPQTVSSHVVLSLLFSAHSDGLSFFFVLALSLLWWSAAIVWVLWALIECLLLFVAVLRCSAFSWATQWRLEQCVSLFFLLLKTACDQAKQLFRSCVSALTECSSASCGEAKQLFESSVHPLSGFFPALYRANFRSRWSEKKELNTM